MTKSSLIELLKSECIRVETISFYVDDSEASFGTCDLTGERGNVVQCSALTIHGDVYHFEAGDWLVHGLLGKLAGAF